MLRGWLFLTDVNHSGLGWVSLGLPLGPSFCQPLHLQREGSVFINHLLLLKAFHFCENYSAAIFYVSLLHSKKGIISGVLGQKAGRN